MTTILRRIGLAVALAGLAACSRPPGVVEMGGAGTSVGLAQRTLGRELAVMTYNVHGLPWPIASGRSADLRAIGLRLRTLRQIGQAPDVVVLQEAFTRDAQQIGHLSGYRYVALGPDESPRFVAPSGSNPRWRLLESGRAWIKGETEGKFVGSGLAILSDFPIAKVRQETFSPPLCAGFDCLAAKGVMMAQLVLPGSRRVEIATTHLNSRGASAVSGDRADLAWHEQGLELADFIGRNRDPSLPLVVGGDFNVGRAPQREQGMVRLMAAMGTAARDALSALASSGVRLAPDARYELDHRKDWQLSLAGAGSSLVPVSAEVPFGTAQGRALSDHLGYAIRYELAPRASTEVARAERFPVPAVHSAAKLI